MAKRVRKIWLSAGLSVADLAAGLCTDNSYEDLIHFIEEIDSQQQDWEFTHLLKELVDKLMAEEDGTRMGSRDDA